MPPTPPRWPERTILCLDCRRTLHSHDEPHALGHELISLRDERHRVMLVARVWGRVLRYASPPPIVSSMSFLLVVTALAGLIFVLLPNGHHGIGLFMFLAASAGRFFLHALDPHEEIERRERHAPLPGRKSLPSLAGAGAILGTVSSGATAPTPLGRVEAVAFGVTLAATRRSQTGILSDSTTLGFSVTTGDGDVIEIPAGPIEITTHGRPVNRRSARIERYLEELDPLRRDSDDRDPFTHEVAAEIAIRVGDHVAVHNPIKRVGFSPVVSTAYREAARSVFTVEGTPCIELLP